MSLRAPLRSFALMLPALMPSWRFFDVIAPSPRIHFRVLTGESVVLDWREYKPRPLHLSALKMLLKIFWNPQWNEQLFLVSCAERILAAPNDHSENEIAQRIAQSSLVAEVHHASCLQFKIMQVQRAVNAIQVHPAFTSKLFDLHEIKR